MQNKRRATNFFIQAENALGMEDELALFGSLQALKDHRANELKEAQLAAVQELDEEVRKGLELNNPEKWKLLREGY